MTFTKVFRRGDRVRHDAAADQRGAFATFVRYSGDGHYCVVDFGGIAGLGRVAFADIKHAPVEIVGPLPRRPPTVCPDCGGTLTLDVDAVMYTPRAGQRPRKRHVRAVFCDGCEFVSEASQWPR